MHRFIRFSVIFLFAVTLRAAGHPEMLVSTSWLEQHLYDRDLTVVEIGDRAAYAGLHIVGARWIPLSDMVVQRDGIPNELPELAALEQTFSRAGIPNYGRIVLYSRDPIAAARAFFTLDYVGRGADIGILDGGLSRWTLEGLPTGRGTPPVVASSFKAHARPDVLVDRATVRLLSEASPKIPRDIALVDARSPEQFCGAESGEGVSHPGHIAQAVNVPWNENLGAGKAGLYRAARELNDMYRDAGVGDGATIVTYCRTGMQASVNYFVLRYLGRDVRLYDGSYIEWSRMMIPDDRTIARIETPAR